MEDNNQNQRRQSGNKKNNITQFSKYRKPLNINIGMVIFGVIFIYIIICIVIYFRTDHLVGYEVKKGSLSVNNVYRGIALRDETVVNSEDAGYLNYYVSEGERVAVNNLVYSIDESGKLAENLGVNENDENQLSDSDLKDLRSTAINYKSNFSTDNFSSVYDFKYNVKGAVLKIENNNILKTIDALGENSGLVKLCYSALSGVIVYSVDGFENKQPADLIESDFDETEYQKNQLIVNELVAVNDPVYKLENNDDWHLVIPMEDERASELEEEQYVKVKFLKNQDMAWGKVTVLHNSDGKCYVQLDFTNSMVTFCTDRFLDVELITEEESGLKIPNSSIIEKNFFLIPEDYITVGGNADREGVLRQSFTESGDPTTEFVETTVYNVADGEYYLDEDTLNIGDVLFKPDSTETFTVSKQASLVGVYNINKGYADFKQIIVLYSNEEYSIVESNTKYGLNVYDYIALNAENINEYDFVYQ